MAMERLTVGQYDYDYYALHFGDSFRRLPFSIRILVENILRNQTNEQITADHLSTALDWPNGTGKKEIPFLPGRVILQDFTGVPAVVDLAAMREEMARKGKDPQKINPLVPVDLVIDHSVQVDFFGTPDAYQKNVIKEFERNQERYTFLKWAQNNFKNLRIVPPGTGIVHQVNLEYLAKVVMTEPGDRRPVVFPDTLVGTDSHTTMINGISVVGWGVGGIEAEAVMLGQPYYMILPEVIGVKLVGAIQPGRTATDLVLAVTETLRKQGVVGKFVEFFGPGLASLSLPDRATIANMAPEYGATMGFFPVDSETLRFLSLTGRGDNVPLVEAYCKAQGLFYDRTVSDPTYSDIVEIDINRITPCLAGPSRPQDRIPLNEMKSTFLKGISGQRTETGHPVTDGSVVLAAITSCTNTSNPSVLIGAGLIAKGAVEKGLKVPGYVKTSFAPGSRVVTAYLEASGLLRYLESLGFQVVGYGCTTCIGNSGPLPDDVAKVIESRKLNVVAVLSGNRNFEARIHPLIRSNFLASPMLVVAYALAGRVDIDFEREPLGCGADGNDIFLKDIWPSHETINTMVAEFISERMFKERYRDVFEGDSNWKNLTPTGTSVYQWDPSSTYIQRAPFFEDLPIDVPPLEDIKGARVLAKLGDSVTTDHISPAGAISPTSPAGAFLQAQGIAPKDFNTYGSRRGNHLVMMRGTLANIRIKNQLLDGVEGGLTKCFLDGREMPIYEAAMIYQKRNVPLIILAGNEYGTGSSRDWAAKGTQLLGVRAVIAQSFERIHRSNLVGMGVLPLEFQVGESVESIGLIGDETYTITGISENLVPRAVLNVMAERADGSIVTFKVLSRLDSEVDIEYYRNGGILQTVLRRF